MSGVPRGAAARRVAVIVLIVAFLTVDGVLIVMASAAAGAKPHGALAPIPTFSSMPSQTPTPSVSPAPIPAAASTPAAATSPSTTVLPRFLVAVNSSTAWRATPGSCAEAAAVIEQTTNSGRTWAAADLSKISARTVLFLSGDATSAAAVVGATSSCTPAFFASFTSGRFWAPYPGRMSEASYIDPSTHALYLAGTQTSSPCAEPRQVVHTSAGTAVVCPGELKTRTATGAWESIPVPGLLAVAGSRNGDSSPGWVIAVSGLRGCAGVAIQAVSGSSSPGSSLTTTGCAAAATPEGVSLSRIGPTMWMWSGEETFVSSDSGATWGDR